MFRTLMTSRRFAPLFWCQLLSAFNDNFVRNMLVMLILYRFGGEGGAMKILLASMAFVLPAIPFSALGGEIADSHDKALIARRLKFAEIFIQAVGAVGLALSSLTLLYLTLFGLGCVAALFGPIKYGILPDHLRREELVAGNALIEGATYAAIIGGLIVGGIAAGEHRSALGVMTQMMALAIGCYVASRYIPPTGVGAPGLKADWNVVASTWRVIDEVRAEPRQWAAAMATSWFWTVGIVVLSLVPVIVKARAGGGLDVAVAVNLIFAVGVGVGALLAAPLSHGRIELAPAPFLLIVLAATLVDLGFATMGVPATTADIPLAEFFASPLGLRLAFDLFVFSSAAGLYVVPIFAAIQAWAGEDRRARVVGAVNALNYLMMVAGSIVTMALLQVVGLSEPTALVILGLANLGAAAYVFRTLPADTLGFVARVGFRLLYRLEAVGTENLPRPGERAVIAVSHVSFLDAAALMTLMDEPPLIAVDRAAARRRLVQPFLKLSAVRPLDPKRPMAARSLISAARAGRALALFPETGVTLTPVLMRDYAALSLMIEKTGALVTPVRIEGAERSLFSRLPVEQSGRRLFPKIKVTVLPPRRLVVPRAPNGRARRRAAGAVLVDLMADVVFETTDIHQTLHQRLEAQARKNGLRRIVIQDPLTGPMSMRMFRIGVGVLARKILAFTAPGETVGVLLPSANGAVVTFMALQAAGRVAAMLNFTAGPTNILGACRAAEIRLVLTSRVFVEKGKLEPLVEAIATVARIVWLEDMRAGVTTRDKIVAAFTAGRSFSERKPDDPALVLFTSGTEGAPKGVALSHVNILANVFQVAARYDLRLADIFFNPLPLFHAFGLTAGTLLPLMTSMRAYLYPTPLHFRQIPQLIDEVGASVLVGTDTFLAGYARNANAYDFRSLRYVISGGEPLKTDTRKAYTEKFGLALFEGYGVTECAPVVAVNMPMFNKPGTVGKLLPHITPRIEPVPGIAEGGRLFVKGPNVMIGYYRADNPGELEPPPGGWHETGDIVTIDADGFVAIKGRAKRFVKIAGELVSLAAIEDLVWGLWPDANYACVAAPDPKRGERVILATTHASATRDEVEKWMRTKGAAAIMVPASLIVLDAMPLLGSGKTDYVALTKAVREQAA